MNQVRKIITSHTAKAYWAYTELLSPRWNATAQAVIPDLLKKALRGIPFGQIRSEEYPRLIDWLKNVPGRDRPDFVDQLDRSQKYEKVGLSRIQLMKLGVLPIYDTFGRNVVLYPVFLLGAPKKDANGKSDTFDARHQFDWLKSEEPFHQERAGIVLNLGPGVLLEGYRRSLCFFRDSSPTDKFEVWWPSDLRVH